MPSPKYMPPAQPGYVFWSNFSHRSSSGALWTPEAIVAKCVEDFAVPGEDVLVVPFEPNGHGDDSDFYVTRWSAFFHERHRALVYLRLAHIRSMLAELECQANVEREMRRFRGF